MDEQHSIIFVYRCFCPFDGQLGCFHILVHWLFIQPRTQGSGYLLEILIHFFVWYWITLWFYIYSLLNFETFTYIVLLLNKTWESVMGVKHDWLDKRKRSKQWPCLSFTNAKSPQIFLSSSLLLPVSFCMYSGFSRDNSGQSFTNFSPDSWLNLIGSHRVLMQPKTLQHFPFFFSIKRKGFNFNKVKKYIFDIQQE